MIEILAQITVVAIILNFFFNQLNKIYPLNDFLEIMSTQELPIKYKQFMASIIILPILFTLTLYTASTPSIEIPYTALLFLSGMTIISLTLATYNGFKPGDRLYLTMFREYRKLRNLETQDDIDKIPEIDIRFFPDIKLNLEIPEKYKHETFSNEH